MSFRIISFKYFDAFMNMALDEAIMEGIRKGDSPSTIRFYGWKPSAVSIGFFQGINYEVNRDVCKRSGVDVVRRMTGGGAVYHDTDGEITYSLLAPVGDFPTNVQESYRVICGDIVFALDLLGIEASFQPINDIVVGEQKISGNAQTRRGGILLQHGTVLYKVDVEKMFSYLNVSEQKISDKLIRSVKKRVTCISDQKQIGFIEVIDALHQSFIRNRETFSGDYSALEIGRAVELAEHKYRTDTWNAMR